MRKVVFLYNELLDEKYQKKLGLSLEFISFAFADGYEMYNIRGKCVAIHKGSLKRTKKNSKIYGGLFILNNSEHFLRVLDASQTCSKSMLGDNHKLDEFHREKIKVTPISFKSVEDFLMLKYNEKEPIYTTSYIGNSINEFIKSNVLNKTQNREISGFDVNNYIDLLIKECEKI